MRRPWPLNRFNRHILLLSGLLFLFVFHAAAQDPTITSFTPASACQGATVTITGTNLKDVKEVRLGSLAASSFKIVDDHTITAQIAGDATSGRITVSTDNKTTSSANDLDIKVMPRPDLADVSPGDRKLFTNCDGNSNYTLTVQNVSANVPGGSNYDINWGDATGHFTQQDWGVGATTTHKYTSQGYFTITLTISPTNGCNNSKSISFYNGANPLASLTTSTSTTGLCTPAGISFIIGGNWAGNTPGTEYELNYGDGQKQTLSHPLNNTGNQQTVSHIYTTSSCPNIDYTAMLNVGNACYVTTYTLNQIVIRAKPVADFETDQQVCLGESVCFTNTTQSGFSGPVCSANTAYTWDFGDNSATSSATNPGCHIYAKPGTYTVTLSASNQSCGASTKTKTVIVKPVSAAPIAGAGKTYCQHTQATALQATGTNLLWYTSASGGTGSPNAPVPSTDNPGTFTWYVSQTVAGNCESPRVPVSVTIVMAPSATISYPAMCSSDKAVTATVSGTGGGSFSSSAGLSIDPSTGTINPSSSQPGSYTVTYAIPAAAPCSGITTTTNVTITQGPAATISYTPAALCNAVSSAQTPNPPVPVTLQGTSGGRYSINPGGLVIDANNGTVSPSGASVGNYTITYTMKGTGGCKAAITQATVSVSSAPSASISYDPVCTNDAQANVHLQGTAGGSFSAPAGLTIDAVTGSVNPAASTPGTYTVTYKIAPSPPCAGFTTTATVMVTKAPAAAINYPKTNLCNVTDNAGTPNKPVDAVITGDKGGVFTITPANGLSIDRNTGQLNPSGATQGNYTITYTLTGGGGCSIYTTTAAVSVNSAPAASISYPPICSTDKTVTVQLTGAAGGSFSSTTGLVIDALTGVVSPAASTPGTYTVTYSIAAQAPCPGLTTTATLTITKAPAAAISYPKANLCNIPDNPQTPNKPVDVILTGDKAGRYTISPATGLPIDAITGQLNPSSAVPGNYTITYTLPPGGGCQVFSTTTTVSVSNAPEASISYPVICSTDPAVMVQLKGTLGGTFSSTAGLSIDAATGTITPGTSIPGNYTVTYTIAPEAPCPGVITSTKVTIAKAPVAAISYPKATLCNVENSTQTPNLPVDVTISGDKGGNFAINPANGLNINTATGQLNPSGATPGNYTISYTILAAGGCQTVTTSTTISVSSAPAAAISYPPVCSGDATVPVQLTGNQGGIFTAPTGLSLDSHTGALTPTASTPGTYTVTYTIAAEAPCPGFAATASVTITKAPAATINYDKPVLCNVDRPGTPNLPVAVTLTGDKGGVFTISPAQGLPLDPSTGTLTPAGAVPGTYVITYTLQGTGGCTTFKTTAQVQVNAAADATFNYPASPYCGAIATPQLPVFNGTQGGVYRAQDGLAIDPATGAVDPSKSKPGVYHVLYTIATTGPCPSFVTTASVEISASPTITFDKNEQSICSGSTATFVPSADVSQTVFNWSVTGGLPTGIAGAVEGSVTGSGTPIVLSYTNTSAASQALHILVSPVNPSGNPCPGAPYELILHVNPIPAALTGDTTRFCMHAPSAALITNAAPGNTVKWYDAGGTPLNAAPVPLTQRPDTFAYRATQVNSYGCESPQANFVAIIHPVVKIDASAFTNPSACGLPSGTITLKVTDLNGNLMPFIPVTMTYKEFNTPRSQLDTTDRNGSIVMALSAGQYSALVVNTYGCPSAQLDKLFELKDPTPPSQPLAGYNGNLCTGAALVLTASSATSNVSAPVNYIWVGPAFGSSADTTQQTTITFPNAMTGYEGTYIVYAEQQNCISPATSFPVSVKQGPLKPSIVTRSPLCTGDLLTLQAYSTITGNYPLQFTWNGPGRGFPVTGAFASLNDVKVSDGGIYSVTVYAPATGCSATSDTLVSIGANPAVTLKPDTLHLPTGYMVPLVPVITNGNDAGVLPVKSYTWTPMDNLTCNDDSCSQPVLTVAANACYSVKVTNVYGCSGSATTCVQAFCTDAQVFIPNAFTPRKGLAENQVFMVRASGIAAVKSLLVFNRWGKVVFEKHNFSPNDISAGWDGTVNGKLADTGVYVYMVNVVCENGFTYNKKGNVTLLQ